MEVTGSPVAFACRSRFPAVAVRLIRGSEQCCGLRDARDDDLRLLWAGRDAERRYAHGVRTGLLGPAFGGFPRCKPVRLGLAGVQLLQNKKAEFDATVKEVSAFDTTMKSGSMP